MERVPCLKLISGQVRVTNDLPLIIEVKGIPGRCAELPPWRTGPSRPRSGICALRRRNEEPRCLPGVSRAVERWRRRYPHLERSQSRVREVAVIIRAVFWLFQIVLRVQSRSFVTGS
jgi:hypothetical protein